MIEGLQRIEFNSAGFREILMSGGVQGLVTETAADIQGRANANIQEESEGYAVEVIACGFGGGRWIGFVSTTDKASMIAESENKALTRAVF